MNTPVWVIAAALALNGIATEPKPTEPLPVYLLLGQSNMTGADSAVADTVPGTQPEDSKVLFWNRAAYQGKVWENDDAFGPLRVQSSAPYGGQIIGPEFGFVRELRSLGEGRRMAIIKISFPSTSMASEWAEQGFAYRALQAEMTQAIAASQAAGEQPVVRGILVHQGISDALHGEAKAQAYGQRLREFIARVRKAFAQPDTPVVLTRANLSPLAPRAHMEIVRAAIVATAEHAPHAAWINVDDLERVRGHHFTGAAQMEIGRRYAAALLRLSRPAHEEVAEPKWMEIACPEAEYSLSRRVQVGRTLDDFEASPLPWRSQSGGQNAQSRVARAEDDRHAGQASLQVDYEFVGKEEYEYVGVERSLEIPDDANGLGFWVKREPVGFHMAVRVVDRSGEVHQFGVEESAGDGGHFAVALFRAATIWGGDGNRRLDKPLRLHSLVFDRPQPGYRGLGRLWIDDLQVVQPLPPSHSLRIEVGNKQFGNLYRPGEVVDLRAAVDSGRVGWRIEDFWGTVLERQTSSDSSATVALRLEQPGFYAVHFDCQRDGAVVETRTFRCAALVDAPPAAQAFLGFSCHFGQDAYPLECFDLLKRYGFLRYRDEIGWVHVERERGRYALPDFAERYLRRSRELGMEPLIIFDYANPHYDQGGFPNSPEAIAGFAAYAVELARLTRGAVNEFEIWNEWIGGCGMRGRPGNHGPEAYGRLMQATYSAVHAAVPETVLVGIGGEYGPHCAENVARAIRSGGAKSLDAFSIHPYRYPRTPEASDLIGEVQAVLNRAVECGAPRRMWITEIGYPTHRGRGGSDERTQARLAVRTLALLQATEGVEKVYWYDLKNDGLAREYNEHNFGIVLHQQFSCAPKPAIVAMSVFARLTAGAKPGSLQRQGNRHVLRYRKPDGAELLVLWASEGHATCTLRGSNKRIFDLMGCEQPRSESIKVSEYLIYVQGENLHAADGKD